MGEWLAFGVGIFCGIIFTIIMLNVASNLIRPRKYYLTDDED